MGAAQLSEYLVSETPENPTISIGPMEIHPLDSDELTRRLILDVKARKKTRHVITANAQFYNLAEQREDFRECIARAEYVCADGISVVLACKWLGKQDVSRVPGVDMVDHLCKAAAAAGYSTFFLGGQEGAAEQAAAVLTERYPGLRVAGTSCPSWGFERDEEKLEALREELRQADPSIVFVALGAPKQELFINRHIRPLGIPVAIGVGGSFEMIAGRVRRAPMWMQRTGLEWAYRWIQEPRRLANRYLVGNALFCFYLLRYVVKGNLRKESQA
jgi:N-acetylglucosaminyldiphosphoundecaprenol N-acetyl-beta-D-mannosaminyltransferase